MARRASSPGAASTSNSAPGGGGSATWAAVTSRDRRGREAALNDLFGNGREYGDGFTLDLRFVTSSDDGEGAIADWAIMRNGQRAGTLSREFYTLSDGTRVVGNELMTLHEPHRGHGFSTAFSKHAEAAYRRMGVKQVFVHAALQDGGLTWAKAGFRFNGEKARATLNDLAPRFRRLALRRDATPQHKALARRFTDAQREARSISRTTGDVRQYNALMASLPSPRMLIRDRAVAERVFTGANWYGVKNL